MAQLDNKDHQQIADPGLGAKYYRRTKRVINKDGSFNVRREGLKRSTENIYQDLINMSWGRFSIMIFIVYILLNLIFALTYFLLGKEAVSGIDESSVVSRFIGLFFFSVQTFTTVGYGGVMPSSQGANAVVTLEAMIGFLSFSLATGLFYGRFSKPNAKILFSDEALISPYRGINALMFRIANKRQNQLMDIKARVLFSWVDKSNNEFNRKYFKLDLEVNEIIFFPLSWTIVHPIDEKSPLYGKSRDELIMQDAEVSILLTGFDETFSQTVHQRFSYRFDEVQWGAKFERAFSTDEKGEIIMDLNKIGTYQDVNLN